ncbi:MAG TPA: nucleotidyltransferase family protein, partial [Casimicrobiaceae bacterium]|nr:nucleotidyltransferase family protein [Casimicrobiaceae bacterium]
LRSYEGALVLLKGAAYEFAELPPRSGRVAGDIDVMVPRERIDEVERALVGAGWRLATDDAYDERYYREWSHEIPALVHEHRETAIDLHHTLAPPLGCARPDAAALLADLRPTPLPRIRVLAPADMTLHAALHLFQEEVSRPLRDLFDIDRLLRHFGRDPAFWTRLCERASVHRVERPLYYALRAAGTVFRTPIPGKVVEQMERFAPNALLAHGMDRLFDRRFRAHFVVSRGLADRAVRSALRARSQYLRMPTSLLARHLLHKATRGARERWRRLRKQGPVQAKMVAGIATPPD